MKFSKRIVTLIVILNVMFAIGVLVVFWHTGSEPGVLIGSWFGFTGGELWMLTSIKKKKIISSEKITIEDNKRTI